MIKDLVHADPLPAEQQNGQLTAPQWREECPHCGLKPATCPFCGAPAKIFGQNMVGCSDTVNCGGNVDFGHWCGYTDDGIPAEHFVIEQWNKRASPNDEGKAE